MHRKFRDYAVACALPLLLPATALAHAVCGPRVFPVTLTLDDPGAADEATLPQVTYQRSGADGGPGPQHDTNIAFEWDKRITDNTAIIFNDDFNVNQTNGAKTQTGWDDLTVTGKWAACLDEPQEFMLGFGVQRELGRSGTSHIGSDEYGNTAPTVYFGKGFGNLPIPALRPFALTGEISYGIADVQANTYRVTDPKTGISSLQVNNGYPNELDTGFSLQYSIPYLQSQVKNYGLPSFFAHLVPLVEISSATTTGNGGEPTAWTIAPGFIYINRSLQVGLEALIPANKAAGTNVGVTLQVHLFFDDLFPHTLGAPLFHF
ncbi:MAG TPA: hypothetical protein VMB71_10240 [Acetobacteraceae bacterium]|nr:hypothetical protein [Acetobacteraceae bacterium]